MPIRYYFPDIMLYYSAVCTDSDYDNPDNDDDGDDDGDNDDGDDDDDGDEIKPDGGGGECKRQKKEGKKQAGV